MCTFAALLVVTAAAEVINIISPNAVRHEGPYLAFKVICFSGEPAVMLVLYFFCGY
jgi:hypothetical protein